MLLKLAIRSSLSSLHILQLWTTSIKLSKKRLSKTSRILEFWDFDLGKNWSFVILIWGKAGVLAAFQRVGPVSNTPTSSITTSRATRWRNVKFRPRGLPPKEPMAKQDVEVRKCKLNRKRWCLWCTIIIIIIIVIIIIIIVIIIIVIIIYYIIIWY